MVKVKKRKRRRKRKLPPESRIARRLKTDVRTIFTNSGFEQIPTLKTNISIENQEGEFDSIYLLENILIIVETTTISKQKEIVKHIRKKHEFYKHTNDHKQALFSVLKKTFPKFRGYMNRYGYEWEELEIKYVYCSLNTIDQEYRHRYGDICIFLEYPYLKYFLLLSKIIKYSIRSELLKFLNIDLKNIGSHKSGSNNREFHGLLLPETPSGFPTGHKVVSFLVDPQFLLEQSYVLRSDSWRDTNCLYQRLLIKGKIDNMRDFLVSKKRAYINNIIATLPSETTLIDEHGKEVSQEKSNTIKSVTIKIPVKFNSIGIIDGQHRLYSYHEGNDKPERHIKKLREKQHLLITGLVYPKDLSENKKQRFEAELFLEINDKQKRVKGDIRQAIEMIVNPNSSIAISKAVVAGLSSSGPLTGLLEVHFYDTGKIKTTSIVSYGMKHIVGIDGDSSLYKKWRGKEKKNIKSKKSVRDNYINFCISEISKFIAGFKVNIDDQLWTSDKKVSRVLTTTTINGLVFCFRRIIENNKRGDFDFYAKAFKKMTIKFTPEEFIYKSSHWKDLGETIYEQCFR